MELFFFRNQVLTYDELCALDISEVLPTTVYKYLLYKEEELFYEWLPDKQYWVEKPKHEVPSVFLMCIFMES